MHLNIALDLDLTTTNLQRNLDILLRVLPDDCLLQGIEAVAAQPDINEEMLKQLMAAGLTALVVRGYRSELDRRANTLQLKGGTDAETMRAVIEVGRS